MNDLELIAYRLWLQDRGLTAPVVHSQERSSQIVFVTDFPEGESGEVFSGEGRELVKKMVKAMHLEPEQVSFATAFDTSPPEIFSDGSKERARKRILEYINEVKAGVVVIFGPVASQAILATTEPFRELRGKWCTLGDAKVMPTFHPRDLLRFPQNKKLAWEDLQLIMAQRG